jgi:glycosyltransferase involved in cell wall biosynthesis
VAEAAGPPRVSIIVPCFNAGTDLERAISSAVAQTYRDFEVVVVDDGSTDAATLATLSAVARRPGVTVHRTENRGPSAARNTAITRSRGAYILPLDADDYLAATYLARTVPLLDEDATLGVAYTWVGLTGQHTGTWKTGDFTVPALLVRCTLHVTALYRREVWAAVGGYDPRFVDGADDWDFWLSAAGRGVTARCVPEVLAYYQRSDRSRERKARAPGVAGRVMRMLVTKHRALYEAHLEEALAGLYEHLAATSLTLERVYQHPAIRLGVRLRRLVQGDT